MTQSEWEACADPTPMLHYLRGKAGDRELRLFLVVCARSRLPAAPDQAVLEALATGERFADGDARASLGAGHRDRVAQWPSLYNGRLWSVPAWHAVRDGVVRAARDAPPACVKRKAHDHKAQTGEALKPE